MILEFLAFYVWHLLAFALGHCLPGIFGAALLMYKGYFDALVSRGTVGGGIRGCFAVLMTFACGLGGLFTALLLPTWEGKPRGVEYGIGPW